MQVYDQTSNIRQVVHKPDGQEFLKTWFVNATGGVIIDFLIMGDSSKAALLLTRNNQLESDAESNPLNSAVDDQTKKKVMFPLEHPLTLISPNKKQKTHR